MWHSVKGGRRGRGGNNRAVSREANRGPEADGPPGRNLRDEDEPLPNDSTQAVGDVALQGSMEVPQAGEGSITTVPPIKKRGRGPAKGTQFERLRKLGKIPLQIKDGHRGPSCENASIFSGRVTWIIKIYAEMRHASWSEVTEVEKQELIDRVKADFVLDWTRDNVREMVVMFLAEKYNAYHYELHKVYNKYASHEEAISGGTSMVDKAVWDWLCARWASSTFKEQSRRNTNNKKKQKVKHTGGRKSFVRHLEEKSDTASNMVEFYKEMHWSRQKQKFINATTEHNYNLMVEKLNEVGPEEEDDAAATVFKEVLGFKSGYANGMGHSVIPDVSPTVQKNKSFMRLAEENERNKTNAEIYKNKLDQMMGDVVAMKANFSEYEKAMNIRMSVMESNSESRRETQGDA